MGENTHLTPEYKARLEASLLIERDAQANTPDVPAAPAPHVHEEIKSFIATPRMDQPLLQKMLGWVRGELPPGTPIVHKSADGLRYMFLITSNSYVDREGEAITGAALKAYEASCYPGDDLFHCDNPFLWWHDDEVPIGTIEAVEYVEPFLVEVAKEIDDPIARLVWDYAERNGDRAGTSHRFGYLEKDRDPDGTFHRIFKQETTFLPERQLAANDKTYAGVLKPMTIPESRKRLGQIIKEATGLDDLANLIETDVAAARKRLTDMGVQHKALKPTDPAPSLPTDPNAVTSKAVGDVPAADPVEADASAAPPSDLPGFMAFMQRMYGMVMDMVMDIVDSQAGLMERQNDLAKALDETRTAEKTKTQGLEAKAHTLEQTSTDQDTRLKEVTAKIDVIQKHLGLAPRSVQTQPGETADAVKAAVDQAQKAREDDNFEEVRGWGKLKPPPKYD